MSANSGNNALSRDTDFSREFIVRHKDKLIFGSDCSCTDGKGSGVSQNNNPEANRLAGKCGPRGDTRPAERTDLATYFPYHHVGKRYQAIQSSGLGIAPSSPGLKTRLWTPEVIPANRQPRGRPLSRNGRLRRLADHEKPGCCAAWQTTKNDGLPHGGGGFSFVSVPAGWHINTIEKTAEPQADRLKSVTQEEQAEDKCYGCSPAFHYRSRAAGPCRQTKKPMVRPRESADWLTATLRSGVQSPTQRLTKTCEPLSSAEAGLHCIPHALMSAVVGDQPLAVHIGCHRRMRRRALEGARIGEVRIYPEQRACHVALARGSSM